MKYQDFLECQSLKKTDLLAWANQTLIEDVVVSIPSLPAPPMLMFDRMTKIQRQKKGGVIVAEQDIHLDAWYFLCHFRNDPVQPGCLGVDAIWQLLGMYCALSGAKGSGRALGCKEVDFFGQIRPHDKTVRYEVNVRRYSEVQGVSLVIGSGSVFVDDVKIYTVEDAKVGVFSEIQYADYPHKSGNSKGGLTKK